MFRLRLALATIAALLAPLAAQADVILNFGPTPLVPAANATTTARFEGQIVLTDAAFANGFAIGISNTTTAPFSASVEGLRGFSASITPGFGPVRATLAGFLKPIQMGASGQTYVLALSGGGGQPVTGSLRFNNTSSNFDLSFSTATGFSGIARTDGDFAGCFAADCTFGGRIAIVVPEPAGLAVLAVGGLALAGFLRRRSRAAG